MSKNNLNYQKFSTEKLKTLIQKYNYKFNPGDIIVGKCFSIESEGMLIDTGAETTGYIPLEQIPNLVVNNFISNNQLLETREFYIFENRKDLHRLILSINYIDYIKAWERIKQLYSEDVTLITEIIDKNKGGLIVRIEGIEGFIPNSHIITTNNNFNIGHTIPVKFLTIKEKNNSIVLSHKRLVLQNKTNYLRRGQPVEGIIKEIKQYGIFINIEEITGLLHISEINKNYHQDLSNFFHIGDKIIVYIVHMDMKRARVTLTMNLKK
uniref:ribosomal protein S1 n=1 Tax=Pulvinaster venetus TaxID=427767 RepID=UPI001FCD6E73|nr:ribosomal protein S1 [Pulvinaster venetus]UNJ17023.1 ribosomal protein S1 [Pulvinaster venetus]